MRAVLRRPDFRLLFIGLFFSMTAASVLLLALAIWVKSLTGSDGMAGATILAIAAPAVFAPLIGYVVDRFRRRPFLVATNLTAAASLVPLLFVHDRSQVWIIYAVAAAYGVVFLADSAALTGMIKIVVPDELLNEANGALQTVKQGLRLFGPLLGAGLYTALGGWAVAVIAMAGFVIAAGVLAGLRVSEEAPARGEHHLLAEMVAGFRHVTGHPGLRRVVIGLVIAIAVFGFSESVFFALVDQGLHRPPGFVGVIVSVQGIGGLLGGLAAAKAVRRLGEIGTVALGLALFLPLITTSIVPHLWLVMPTVALGGAGLPLLVVGLMTLLQRATPASLMGRASTAVDAMISGPQALSIGVGAILVEVLDFRVIMAGMAVVITAAAAWTYAGRRLTPPMAPATETGAVDDVAVEPAAAAPAAGLAPTPAAAELSPPSTP